MNELDKSLIRVCDAQGETWGTGFVVSDSVAVTCAHVAKNCGVKPGGRVHVVFHLNGEDREAEVLAEFWRAPDGDDIAVLRLLPEGGRLPEGIKPLTLGSTRHCNGHSLRTAGFAELPAGYEFAWAEGRIRGVVPHPNKQAMLQMDAAPILRGMSGAPVLDLDTQRVVGIVNEFMRDASLQWATTSDTLAVICPDLRLHHPQAVEDYLKAVAQFCRDLPYVSLKSNVLLGAVYVRQQMRQELIEGQRASDEKIVRRELAMRACSPQPMPVAQALEQHPRLVVVGGPGAGKSTLLRYLVQGLAEGRSGWLPHLPILVSVRGFAERGGDLTTSLGEQIRADLGKRLLMPLPGNFLIDWKSQTDLSWLIALDGLDEIVNEQARRNLIHELNQARWPTGSRVLMTTRADTSALPDGFAPFDLLPFGPEQVKEFVCKWFRPDEARARAFLERLDVTRMGDLIGTPLLLTVAATVFERSPDVSSLRGFRRSKLYGEFARILLDEDAASNRRMREQFCEQFGTDLSKRLFDYRREVLESIAMALQEGRKVRDALVECLQQVVGWSAQDAQEKADSVLEILVQQRTGLVVRRGSRYEFIHPSFREYLYASALVQACGSDLEEVWSRVVARLAEENWREVVLFTLGILSDASTDVTALLERIWNTRRPDIRLTVDALVEQVQVTDAFANRVEIDILMLARDEMVDAGVRVEAAEALGRLGHTDNAVPILLALVRDRGVHAWNRQQAAEALGRLGRADDLLTLARDETVDTGVRQQAAEALGRLGRADDLLTLARDETVDVEVRGRAAEALGRLGHTDNAVPILLVLARDETVDVWGHLQVVEALGRLGRTDALLALARDETVDVWGHLQAVEALGRLGRADDLLTLARNETVDARVRWRAVEALGRLGRAADAVPIVLALARDRGVDAKVRSVSLKMLGSFGRPSILPELERIAKKYADEDIRQAARRAVEQIRRRMKDH